LAGERPTPSCGISVVVPVYNIETYIEHGLESLAAQTFDDFEVFVVDDGSTDRSLEVIERFCAKRANFTSITQPNGGIGAARNAGIERANGRFLAFLDGDDAFSPVALEVMYRTALETGADLVIGNYDVFDELRTWRVADVSKLFERPEYGPFDPRLLVNVAAWNKLYRRSVIDEHHLRFSHVRVAEDVAFMPFAHHCRKIATVDEIVCHYRRHAFIGDYRPPQPVTPEFVEDFCEAYEDIRISARAHLGDREEHGGELPGASDPRPSARAYCEEVLRRESMSLVNLWHQSMWLAEPRAVEMIASRLHEIRDQLTFDAWNGLKTRFRVYRLEETMASYGRIAEIPLVTIAAHHGSSHTRFARLIRSLYAQKFPRFELLICAEASELLPPEHRNRENIVCVDARDAAELYNAALMRPGCEHMVFTCPDFLYQPDGIRTLFAAAENKYHDVVTSVVYSTSTRSAHRLARTQAVAFAADDSGRRDAARIRRWDRVLGNKMVRRSFLATARFSFTSDTSADVLRLYRAANLASVDAAVTCTDLTDRRFEHALGGLSREERRELRRAGETWLARALASRADSPKRTAARPPKRGAGDSRD